MQSPQVRGVKPNSIEKSVGDSPKTLYITPAEPTLPFVMDICSSTLSNEYLGEPETFCTWTGSAKGDTRPSLAGYPSMTLGSMRTAMKLTRAQGAKDSGGRLAATATMVARFRTDMTRRTAAKAHNVYLSCTTLKQVPQLYIQSAFRSIPYEPPCSNKPYSPSKRPLRDPARSAYRQKLDSCSMV